MSFTLKFNTTMTTHRPPLKRLSLSPLVWKDHLRQRCIQRLKTDRRQLIAKLRRPGTCTSLSEEIQLLVANEQHKATLSTSSGAASAGASVDDMLLLGHLQQSEYLDIIHALEDALLHEIEEEKNEEEDRELRLAEHMVELEEAELEAMLASMELIDKPQHQQELSLKEQQQHIISVLCPVCKAGYLREQMSVQAPEPYILCSCGFTFHTKHVYHSVLEDFQEIIVNAFMTHRNSCSADPLFKKKTSMGNDADVLCIQCTHCGCDKALS